MAAGRAAGGAAGYLSAWGEDQEGRSVGMVRGGGLISQQCRLGVGHLLSGFWREHLCSLLSLRGHMSSRSMEPGGEPPGPHPHTRAALLQPLGRRTERGGASYL